MYNPNKEHIDDMTNLENLHNASEDEFLNQATYLRETSKTRINQILKIVFSIGAVVVLYLLITKGIDETISILLLFGLISFIAFLLFKISDKDNNQESSSIMNNEQHLDGINIDFSSMNLEELSNQVNHYLNKGEPITLWGMGRENEKIIFKAEKVLILQKLFEYLKSMGESLAEYKASVFLHSEYIQDYINNYRINKQRQSEIDEQLHLNRILELKNAEREMQLDYSSRELEINRQQAEIDRIKVETDIMRIKAQAEASYKEAKTIGQIEVASLIREFVAQVDLTTINPSMNAYLMKVLFHPGNDDYVDMEMNEMMKEMMRKTKDAEINKKNAETEYKINESKIKAAEARSMNYKAQGDKLTLDREKNKYKNN